MCLTVSGKVRDLLEFLLDQPEMARISDTGVRTRNPAFTRTVRYQLRQVGWRHKPSRLVSMVAFTAAESHVFPGISRFLRAPVTRANLFRC